jgi:hypothetical protein
MRSGRQNVMNHIDWSDLEEPLDLLYVTNKSLELIDSMNVSVAKQKNAKHDLSLIVIELMHNTSIQNNDMISYRITLFPLVYKLSIRNRITSLWKHNVTLALSRNIKEPYQYML